MSYELIYKKVGDLLPYINNARTHSEEQINQIAASIREFGFTNPLLIDGVGTIIAGHGRLHGAKKSGLEEVPCIVLDHLTKAQQKALIIADNQLALNAGWDMDLLSVEMKDLDAEGFDLSLMGFNDDMLANMLKEETEGLTDEDAVPDVPDDPVTVLGDVWVLGKHRLMCGDSTSIDAVEKLINGAKIDLVHTDPPYGMNAVSKSGVLSKNYKSDILGDDNPDAAKDSFNLVYGMLPDAKHIWWGANYYSSALPDSECWLVWDKNNGESDQTDCELAWANFRSVVRQFTQSSEKTNRVHPTQKPVSLMEWIIKRFKLSSKTILDVFGGSGSTLIAAEKHGIDGYIMELDPKYCDVIIQRWCDFTGEDAILERTGETFSVLKKEQVKMPRKPTGKPNGRPPFKPTDEERKQVGQMVAVGIPQEQIAMVIRDGIDADTLAKHFKKEIRESKILANAKVGGTLFNKIMNGDTSAAIFWAKTQMGWKETQAHEHMGKDGKPIVLWGGKNAD
jgi:16S rRNA G966 N2-methylase RsmD